MTSVLSGWPQTTDCARGTASRSKAFYRNTKGGSNTSVGYQSLTANTEGIKNTTTPENVK